MLKLYKRYAKQVVFTAHNLVPHDTGESMVDKCRRYYERVDKIIVHTARTKREMVEQMGIDERKIFVIPHGVLTSSSNREKVESIKDSLRKALNLEGKMVFSTLGLQSDYKGTDIIKEAFVESGFLNEHQDVVLVAGGKGDIIVPYKGQPENLYVNNERISDEEFDALLEISDVLLMPYKKISQSGVLLTAIEKHVPYLATDVGGLCEPLDIATVGWKLQSATAGSLEEAILKLLENKEQVVSIKNDKERWRKVEEAYNWGRIRQLTQQCYQQ